MNSECCWRYEYNLVCMPKVLYQTNRHIHEKLQRLEVAALGQSDQRRFYDDETCEKYILHIVATTSWHLRYIAATLLVFAHEFTKIVLLRKRASTQLVEKEVHACSHRQLFVEQRSSLGCDFVCLTRSQQRWIERRQTLVCVLAETRETAAIFKSRNYFKKRYLEPSC